MQKEVVRLAKTERITFGDKLKVMIETVTESQESSYKVSTWIRIPSLGIYRVTISELYDSVEEAEEAAEQFVPYAIKSARDSLKATIDRRLQTAKRAKAEWEGSEESARHFKDLDLILAEQQR